MDHAKLAFDIRTDPTGYNRYPLHVALDNQCLSCTRRIVNLFTASIIQDKDDDDEEEDLLELKDGRGWRAIEHSLRYFPYVSSLVLPCKFNEIEKLETIVRFAMKINPLLQVEHFLANVTNRLFRVRHDQAKLFMSVLEGFVQVDGCNSVYSLAFLEKYMSDIQVGTLEAGRLEQLYLDALERDCMEILKLPVLMKNLTVESFSKIWEKAVELEKPLALKHLFEQCYRTSKFSNEALKEAFIGLSDHLSPQDTTPESSSSSETELSTSELAIPLQRKYSFKLHQLHRLGSVFTDLDETRPFKFYKEIALAFSDIFLPSRIKLFSGFRDKVSKLASDLEIDFGADLTGHLIAFKELDGEKEEQLTFVRFIIGDLNSTEFVDGLTNIFNEEIQFMNNIPPLLFNNHIPAALVIALHAPSMIPYLYKHRIEMFFTEGIEGSEYNQSQVGTRIKKISVIDLIACHAPRVFLPEWLKMESLINSAFYFVRSQTCKAPDSIKSDSFKLFMRSPKDVLEYIGGNLLPEMGWELFHRNLYGASPDELLAIMYFAIQKNNLSVTLGAARLRNAPIPYKVILKTFKYSCFSLENVIELMDYDLPFSNDTSPICDYTRGFHSYCISRINDKDEINFSLLKIILSRLWNRHRDLINVEEMEHFLNSIEITSRKEELLNILSSLFPDLISSSK